MQIRRASTICAFIGAALAGAGFPGGARAEEPSYDGGAAGGIGPDVVVGQLGPTVINWGYQNTVTGYITGLSIGTISCNIGTEPLQWEQSPSVHHPVIRGAMYRLKDNRFEQIGISWVKHGFFATNEVICNLLCTAPAGHDGTSLYPGCSDPYDANLNGTRVYLGPASQINAHTGGFSNPIAHPTTSGQNGRLQVHNADLDPLLNPGARYYMEGHYVAADDAAAENDNNNASYQRAGVVSQATFPNDGCGPDGGGGDPQRFCVTLADFVHQGDPAIRAWQDFDPSVVETDAQVPGEGLFILAARHTDLGTGFWRYEYALHNLNSDRSGKSFSIPLAIGAAVNNVGFHDVEYHSGEPYTNIDWEASVLVGKILWSTEEYSVNPNANALRWGTLYNFRFDSNAPPGLTTVTVDLFKPGLPDKITINTVGPIVGFIDCNQNGYADGCDVSCEGVGCSQPCGGSDDCNSNTVPDECETDCNNNGIADTCDIVPQGSSLDCNANTVPDECEEDCNHNGIPDTCEAVHDADGDGVNDCDDLCPVTTPPNGCEPPTFVCCRYPVGITIEGYGYYNCLADSGTPLCHAEAEGSCNDDPPPCPTSFCRDGCMVGDGDGDGDFDLADCDALMQCFSGDLGSPAFAEPTTQCLTQFDFDANGAIDLADLEQFRRELAGPGGL